MGKWCGKIGNALTSEIRPGVWDGDDSIIERPYFGEEVKAARRFEKSGNGNDNLNVSLELSVIADPFANQNFQSMKYITFMGSKWEITNVELQYPRMILTIGGIYNGPEPSETA